MSDRWIVIDSLNRRRVAAVIAGLGAIALAAGAAIVAPDGANPSCSPISARFDATDGGSLVLRVCGAVPSPVAGSHFALRYDLQLRIGLVVPVAELLASPKIDASKR